MVAEVVRVLAELTAETSLEGAVTPQAERSTAVEDDAGV